MISEYLIHKKFTANSTHTVLMQSPIAKSNFPCTQLHNPYVQPSLLVSLGQTLGRHNIQNVDQLIQDFVSDGFPNNNKWSFSYEQTLHHLANLDGQPCIALYGLAQTLKRYNILSVDDFIQEFISEDLSLLENIKPTHFFQQEHSNQSLKRKASIAPKFTAQTSVQTPRPIVQRTVTTNIIENSPVDYAVRASLLDEKSVGSEPETNVDIGETSDSNESTSSKKLKRKRNSLVDTNMMYSLLFQKAKKVDMDECEMTKCPHCQKLFKKVRGFKEHIIKEH
ncbi:hypothetical protein HDV06_005915 [Boothiomyces sp. JEL0866]|nr:hypothetical protein HDV06_005915 [Boothiomyces sp. JEL0866]